MCIVGDKNADENLVSDNINRLLIIKSFYLREFLSRRQLYGKRSYFLALSRANSDKIIFLYILNESWARTFQVAGDVSTFVCTRAFGSRHFQLNDLTNRKLFALDSCINRERIFIYFSERNYVMARTLTVRVSICGARAVGVRLLPRRGGFPDENGTFDVRYSAVKKSLLFGNRLTRRAYFLSLCRSGILKILLRSSSAPI